MWGGGRENGKGKGQHRMISATDNHTIRLQKKDGSVELIIDGLLVASPPTAKKAMIYATLLSAFDWDEDKLISEVAQHGLEQVCSSHLCEGCEGERT